MLYRDTVILVYAKAPVAGEVNTRLIPDIGVRAATGLQRDFIHQRLSMLTRAELCATWLMCAPDSKHACFQQCKQQYPVYLYEQSGDDLGQRILNGIKQALRAYKYCIVIGTDAPALETDAIAHAISRLRSNTEVVFVPAEDGGYVLVGMRQAHDYLFQDISWGSSSVMQQSRAQLELHNQPYEELATCWDIDRMDDYQRYLEMKRLNN